MFERKVALLCVFLGAMACSRPPVVDTQQQQQKLKILQFYAMPGVITSGSAATLCYGVDNASTVSVDPAVTQLSPSLNRCFSVMPKATTTYKLTASGTDGVRISESVTVKVEGGVQAEGAVILFFTASERELPTGQSITLCYGAPLARSVRLNPGNLTLPSGEKNCIVQPVQSTTKFTLSAIGPTGRQQEESITVKVGR